MPLPPSRPPLTSFLRKRPSSTTDGNAGGKGNGAAGRAGTSAGTSFGSYFGPTAGNIAGNTSASTDGGAAGGVVSGKGATRGARAAWGANPPNPPYTQSGPAAKPAAGAAHHARRTSVTVSAGAAAVRSSSRGAAGVLEFLRIDDKMAALLPAATRMAALQADCAALLPEMFNTCAVLQFADELLVLAVPNAAIAARLRQRLPNLQQALQQRGWQVKTVRLKVQVGANVPKPVYVKQAIMPQRALTAMADLESALEDEPRNAPLKAALATLLRHQRKPG